MIFDQIEAYLAALLLELRKRGISDLRFVEEARGHLTDATEQGIERGLEATAAQQEAIAQFGSAGSVARTFVSDRYRLFDLMVLLAAGILGLAIAYIDSLRVVPVVTVLFLVIAATICGFLAPRQPWKWALAVGLWTPLLAIVRSGSPQSLAMLLALLLPFAGAYAGMALRRMLVLRLAWSAGSRHSGLDVHDKRGFHFLVMTKGGHIDSELAAVMDDPETQLIPFLERTAPAALGSLGKPESVTDQSEAADNRKKKYEVVFGGDKTIVCNIEMTGGRKVSVHWSRRDT